MNNTAVVGGAVYATDASIAYFRGPWLRIENNTAATGGGVALHSAYAQFLEVGVRLCVCLGGGGACACTHTHTGHTHTHTGHTHTALLPMQASLAGNRALLGQDALTPVQQAWAQNLGCGVGGGGAVCVSGLQPALTSGEGVGPGGLPCHCHVICHVCVLHV